MSSDSELMREWAAKIFTLGRCLDVEESIRQYEGGDASRGQFAADSLDEAQRLLKELRGGQAFALIQAVSRTARPLPPPSD